MSLSPITTKETIKWILREAEMLQKDIKTCGQSKKVSEAQRGENIRSNAWDFYEYTNS